VDVVCQRQFVSYKLTANGWMLFSSPELRTRRLACPPSVHGVLLHDISPEVQAPEHSQCLCVISLSQLLADYML
jgi:hypothetical protein